MKIAYITAHTPFSSGETFVLEEILAMKELGVEILIIPRNPPRMIFHSKAKELLECTVRLPLINGRILFHFFKSLTFNRRFYSLLLALFRNSRTFGIFIKNLVVIPKAIYIASLIHDSGVDHIHVHWGSTTSTIGWLVSEISGIPWSMTLHRWDIAENNMLKLKVESAAFTRCIAIDGMRETIGIVGAAYDEKVVVIHMGARVPTHPVFSCPDDRSEFVIACPANFVKKKGHNYLIEACKFIKETCELSFRCLLIGNGPLEKVIRRQIRKYSLERAVHLIGRLPHDRLMLMYERREIDVVVLPSIITDDGEKEGIPVALMEAMSYGIPVISTNTGGIPELLSNGAGIMVKEKSSTELAEAILLLIKDSEIYRETAFRGFLRIKEEFDIERNTNLLLETVKSKVHLISMDTG